MKTTMELGMLMAILVPVAVLASIATILLSLLVYDLTLEILIAAIGWVILAAIIALLGWTPYWIGTVVYAIAFKVWLEPAIFEISGMYPTVFTNLVFVLFVIVGLVVSTFRSVAFRDFFD